MKNSTLYHYYKPKDEIHKNEYHAWEQILIDHLEDRGYMVSEEDDIDEVTDHALDIAEAGYGSRELDENGEHPDLHTEELIILFMHLQSLRERGFNLKWRYKIKRLIEAQKEKILHFFSCIKQIL